MEYFQDDIYPDTRVTWQAALTAQQWLDGGDELQPCISMRPADMKPCEHSAALVGVFIWKNVTSYPRKHNQNIRESCYMCVTTLALYLSIVCVHN